MHVDSFVFLFNGQHLASANLFLTSSVPLKPSLQVEKTRLLGSGRQKPGNAMSSDSVMPSRAEQSAPFGQSTHSTSPFSVIF